MGKAKKIGIVVGASFLALIVGFTAYASLDNPELEKAEIRLDNVKVSGNAGDKCAELEATFLVKNPSAKTFTISNIDYNIIGSHKVIGKGKYSAEEIPIEGRMAFYSGVESPLTTDLTIHKTDGNAQVFDSLLTGKLDNLVVEGTVTVESAWSLVEKEFQIEGKLVKSAKIPNCQQQIAQIDDAKKVLDSYLESLKKGVMACNKIPDSVKISILVQEEAEEIIVNSALMILTIEEVEKKGYNELSPYKQKIITSVDELTDCLNRH